VIVFTVGPDSEHNHMAVLLSLCPHRRITRRQWKLLSSHPVTSLSLCGYVTAHLEMLTRNWAMSKATSWTKLNRCSANGDTRPRQGFRFSGDSGTPRLAEHKVTDTTSQQSWATREAKERQGEERGETSVAVLFISISVLHTLYCPIYLCTCSYMYTRHALLPTGIANDG